MENGSLMEEKEIVAILAGKINLMEERIEIVEGLIVQVVGLLNDMAKELKNEIR